MIRIRISNPTSLGSWCIKGTAESLARVLDSAVPLMHHALGDHGPKILIWIIPKERTLRYYFSSVLGIRDTCSCPRNYMSPPPPPTPMPSLGHRRLSPSILPFSQQVCWIYFRMEHIIANKCFCRQSPREGFYVCR